MWDIMAIGHFNNEIVREVIRLTNIYKKLEDKLSSIEKRNHTFWQHHKWTVDVDLQRIQTVSEWICNN